MLNALKQVKMLQGQTSCILEEHILYHTAHKLSTTLRGHIDRKDRCAALKTHQTEGADAAQSGVANGIAWRAAGQIHCRQTAAAAAESYALAAHMDLSLHHIPQSCLHVCQRACPYRL